MPKINATIIGPNSGMKANSDSKGFCPVFLKILQAGTAINSEPKT